MDPRAPAGVEHEQRLDSWKEIAGFFRRDPRTVKRWEKERDLPVHRIPGNARSGVYAYADELQRWLEHNPFDPSTPSEAIPTPVVASPPRWRRATVGILLIGALGGAGLLWFTEAAPRAGLERSIQGAEPEIAHAYLGCRYAWSKRTAERLREAVACFTQLSERSPRFAPAYAGLADSYNLLREYSRMPDREAFPRAIAAATKAVELDPQSSLGHRSLAFAAFNWSFDVPTALREFRTAIVLDPRDAEAHHWLATSLMLLGQHPEALAEIGRAQELEPTSASIVADSGMILYAAGRQDEGVEVVTRLAHTEPELVSPHRYLADMHFNRAEYALYLPEARRFAELLQDAEALVAVDEEAQALATGGPPAFLETIRVRRRAWHEGGSGGAFPVAEIESLLGQREQALSHLEEAYARHEPAVMAMGIDPSLTNLRREPGFQALLTRLGLSPPGAGDSSPHAAR